MYIIRAGQLYYISEPCPSLMSSTGRAGGIDVMNHWICISCVIQPLSFVINIVPGTLADTHYNSMCFPFFATSEGVNMLFTDSRKNDSRFMDHRYPSLVYIVNLHGLID